MPRSFHLPPLGPAEDQPAIDIHAEEQPPPMEHIGEPDELKSHLFFIHFLLDFHLKKNN